MRRAETGGRVRVTRGALALLFAVSGSLLSTTLSSATPSQHDLESAKSRLAALQDHLSLVDEQYNQARIKLQEVEAKLAQARRDAEHANEVAQDALDELGARASAAYKGVGSQISLILGASSLADLTDRIEFMGQLAQSDADLALRAERAEQQARWAAQDLAKATQERSAIVKSLADKQAELRIGVAEAQGLIARIEKAIKEAQARQRAAAQQAAAALGITTGDLGGSSGSPPPAPNGNAQAAIDAAYSVLGVPYQYGGASPETGFDCSGLTMWAWSHAGVSLPHSSAMQYSVLPHVDRSQLQPGDLLFFYSPIHHVAMYVGGDRMIHAPHTGDVVRVVPVYWQYFVGAARP